MRVSIILPTFNGHNPINRSVQSVFSQSYGGWELIIVDDYSNPSIGRVIEKKYLDDPRLHIHRNNENMGIQRSLNKGISLAKGEYIARIDDDDWWHDREKLSKQIRFLDNNSEYGMIGTGTVVVDERGIEIFRYLSKESDEEIREIILRKNPFTHSSVLFRRSLINELSGYSEALEARYVEDYDLWLRMGARAKLANLPNHSVSFTLKEKGSLSSDNKVIQLKNSLGLIRQYKKDYRGSAKALFYVYLKFLGYRLYRILPKFLRDKIFSIYKRA